MKRAKEASSSRKPKLKAARRKEEEEKGIKKGEWVFLSVAREKEFVLRWVRARFCGRWGKGERRSQRAKERAEHFSHGQQGGQGDETREQ